jgi:hypothetical protein
VFGRVREELLSRYGRYVETVRGGSDAPAIAHLVVEVCSWAGDRRHRDPLAPHLSDATARRALCVFVVSALGGPRQEETR